jgi:hypothetical protein
MKRLEGAVTSCGTAELEVIECDCGYHMGVDATFVDQVDDAFFDVVTYCPNCKEAIPVRDLLEMEPIEVVVEVRRACVAFRDVEVTANSLKEAKEKAEDEAGGYEYCEKDADYDATEDWHLRENYF